MLSKKNKKSGKNKKLKEHDVDLKYNADNVLELKYPEEIKEEENAN